MSLVPFLSPFFWESGACFPPLLSSRVTLRPPPLYRVLVNLVVMEGPSESVSNSPNSQDQAEAHSIAQSPTPTLGSSALSSDDTSSDDSESCEESEELKESEDRGVVKQLLVRKRQSHREKREARVKLKREQKEKAPKLEEREKCKHGCSRPTKRLKVCPWKTCDEVFVHQGALFEHLKIAPVHDGIR